MRTNAWILGMASLITVMGTGCRLGNQVVKPEDPYANDPSGYYKAGVETLTFCAGSGSSTCQSASVNLLPSLASSVYTNPVIVMLEDPSTGEGYIAASDRSGRAFPILIGADNTTLTYAGATQPETLWFDSACSTQMYLEQSGRLVADSANAGTDLQGLPLSGDIQLQVEVITTFDGDCSASLEAMRVCYLDATQCGSSLPSENEQLQLLAQDYFKKHVDAGVLDLQDPSAFSTLRSISYEVNYR